MKLFLVFLGVIFTASSAVFAGSKGDTFLKEHKFWQAYKVQKDDWLWKIFRKLRDDGVLTGNLAEIEKEVLLRNPHISNKNKIEIGTYVLLPLTGANFVPVKIISEEKSGDIVNYYHFYYQPGDTRRLTEEEVQTRRPAMTRLKVKEGFHIERQNSWSFEAFFSYSQMQTQVFSGGDIKLTSNENYGFGIGYALPIAEKSLLNFYIHGFYEDYARPSNIMSLDNPQSLLKTIGTSLILPLSADWLLATHLEIKETLYALPDLNSISLKSTYQPHMGALVSYSFLESKFFGSDLGFQATYLSNGLGDSFESKDGLSLRIILENRITISEQNFYLQFWYENKSTKTQTTSSETQYLGLSLGWQN